MGGDLNKHGLVVVQPKPGNIANNEELEVRELITPEIGWFVKSQIPENTSSVKGFKLTLLITVLIYQECSRNGVTNSLSKPVEERPM